MKKISNPVTFLAVMLTVLSVLPSTSFAEDDWSEWRFRRIGGESTEVRNRVTPDESGGATHETETRHRGGEVDFTSETTDTDGRIRTSTEGRRDSSGRTVEQRTEISTPLEGGGFDVQVTEWRADGTRRTETWRENAAGEIDESTRITREADAGGGEVEIGPVSVVTDGLTLCECARTNLANDIIVAACNQLIEREKAALGGRAFAMKLLSCHDRPSPP